MTKPTTLAGNNFSSETLVPRNTDGGAKLFSSTATIPASTTVGTITGMVRFHTGDRIQVTVLGTQDLDTGAATTLDVGIAYDDAASGADDGDLFVSLHSAQAEDQSGVDNGSFKITGINFVAAGNGYVTLTIQGGNTTTEGDVTINGVIGRS